MARSGVSSAALAPRMSSAMAAAPELANRMRPAMPPRSAPVDDSSGDRAISPRRRYSAIRRGVGLWVFWDWSALMSRLDEAVELVHRVLGDLGDLADEDRRRGQEDDGADDEHPGQHHREDVQGRGGARGHRQAGV